MFRHLVEFVIAVGSHWIAWSSGVIALGIGIYERLKKRPVAASSWIGIGIVALFISCFLAWQDERVKIESSGSQLLSLTPDDLVHAYKDRTQTQGEALVESYTGKWLIVSGQVGDISIKRDWLTQLSYASAVVTISPRARPTVFLKFGRKWMRPLSALRPDEEIKVRGRIEKIERYSVWLTNCELLDFGTSQAKP